MEVNLRRIFQSYIDLPKYDLDEQIKCYLRGAISPLFEPFKEEFTTKYIQPLFCRFLKQNNILAEYKKLNQKGAMDGWHLYPNMRICDYISSAFDWSVGRTRRINWAVIHSKWVKLLMHMFELND